MDRVFLLQMAEDFAREARDYESQAAVIAKYEPQKAKPLLDIRDRYEAYVAQLKRSAGA